MKLNHSYFLFLILLLSYSCTPTQTEQNNQDSSDLTEDSTEVFTERPDPALMDAKWDTSLVIGEGVIWREPKEEGSTEWKKVHATNIFGFKNEPTIGDRVQIIPLTKDLPLTYSKITKTNPRDDMDEGSPQWYEIELEDIKEQTYFDFKGPAERNGEYPVDVLVVYSTTVNSKYMDKSILNPVDFPKGVTLNLIKGAVDFNNDGSPDVLLCEFCCKDKTKAEDCEYTCSKTYLNFEDKWYLVSSSQPM